MIVFSGYSEYQPNGEFEANMIPFVDHTQISKTINDMQSKSIIQQIHDSYDGSSKILLDEAKRIISSADTEDVKKGERLAILGFTRTEKAINSSNKIMERNQALRDAKLIEYYQTNYPLQKFITLEHVKEINKKYGLVCVTADCYKMDIPEKNLQEIEAFSIKDKDDLVYSITVHQRDVLITHNFLSGERLNAFAKGTKKEEPFYISCPPGDAIIDDGFSYRKDSTFILKDDIVYPKDPIVLKPVVGGFLIVTKWGLEASDPLTVNEKMN